MSVFIIAEAGVNHNGSIETALKLIDAAVEAGADAVKFQTFKADNLVIKGSRKAKYQSDNTDDSDQYTMLKQLELSNDEHVVLANHCKEQSIEFMSTGFDEESIELLIKLGIQRIKVPSGEITNTPFLKFLASKQLPMILSTGMATLDEVEEAVQVIREQQSPELQSRTAGLTILHCTSSYPAPLESVNLNAMKTLAEYFGLPVGYSDHTEGTLVAPMAVAMGAKVIEKHFTLDRTMPGPDHKASLEAQELKDMIADIRAVELAFGSGIKVPTDAEQDVLKVARRSICCRTDLPKGTTLTHEHMIMLRPGDGIPPNQIEKLVGRELVHSKDRHEPLTWEDLGP